jgi:hypothetical protein
MALSNLPSPLVWCSRQGKPDDGIVALDALVKYLGINWLSECGRIACMRRRARVCAAQDEHASQEAIQRLRGRVGVKTA